MLFAVSTTVSPIFASRSIWAKSPFLAGRSTVTSVPKRLRRASSSSLMSSAETWASSTVSLRPSYFGR